jgi:hypothetical protein
MITQFLKLGALLATGRFLKPRLKGLVYIAVVWIVLWFVHSEYVSYVQLSGDTSYLIFASLIKITLYALSIAVYVLFVERRLWPKAVPAPTPVVSTKTTQHTSLPANDDGFDFLRQKKKLKDSSTQLLEKK